jgi:hypothetical protein
MPTLPKKTGPFGPWVLAFCYHFAGDHRPNAASMICAALSSLPAIRCP